MPIGEPFISVECDECGEVSDPVGLTMLAGGGWDARTLRPKMELFGWRFFDGATICPDCCEAQEQALKTAEPQEQDKTA